MKKLILPAMFLLAACAAFSQNADALAHTRQFGFDAAGFLARFFDFSGGGGFGETPYYLSYRKLGEKKNTRLGLGANLGVEGDGDGGANSSNTINFRAGSERFNDFGKRWRAFYGWDFKFSFSFLSTGGSGNSTTQVALGAAPLFGLQFRLNERLSLSSEIAYNFFLTFRDNSGRSRFGASTSFSPPIAVYVNYDF
ncbi:MAG: hypothetical protein HY842_00210 [Bacteroidetes bacterium]|nr:hypothetical protein [Bacteroidota bacterium]